MGWKPVRPDLWAYYRPTTHDPEGIRACGWVERLSPSCYQGSCGDGEWVRTLNMEECMQIVETTMQLKGVLP